MVFPIFLLLALVADAASGKVQTEGSNEEALQRALSATAGERFGATSRSKAANDLAKEVLRVDLVQVDDVTLLAVLLAGATGTRDPREVAAEMLHLGDLASLSRDDVLRAADLDPIGEARLLVAKEIARRGALREAVKTKFPVTNSAAAASILRGLVGEDTEHLAVLFLDTRSRLIRASKSTIGTYDFTIFDPRTLLGEALRLRAASIIVAHNHPSEELEFSREDITATQRLVDAASIVSVRVVDHILITRSGYASMTERGLLPKPR